MTTQIIQIHLSDGTSKNVRVDAFTTVQRVVNVVLDGLGMDRLSFGHFALRLASFSGGLGSISSDTQWLHPSLRMPEVASRYIEPLTGGLQMRFELRIRFIPRGLHEMYQTQMAAFLYLYDQLMTDYLQHISWKIDSDKAFYMCGIMLRKRFPNFTNQNVEKRLDFGADKNDKSQFLRYLPESIVVTTKKKHLHKQVIASYKEVTSLSELEAVFKFMKQLMTLARFDTEIFRVSFGTSWERPVELYIGQYFGIAYKNENTKEPVSLADLRNVIDVSIRRLNANSEQCVLRIKISGNTTPMIITTSTINMAESLAHLIDGYQMILSQQRSVWQNRDLKNLTEAEISNKVVENQRKKSETLSPFVRRKFIVPPNELQNNIESASLTHIEPSSVRLEELVGSGQYGNVYRGNYTQNGKRTQVAVKVCKCDSDGQDANKVLMEEAYTMSQFHHRHIIQLVGIACANCTVWIVLELASLGELKQYLKREQQSIDLSTQLLFAKQLTDAIAYLTKHDFIHRDIAARNVLVSNSKCVKLSDFGMCRQLDDEIYTSNSTKLPLKWMPYESLSYRKFTKQSDVYMLGVCIWEILSFGEKPWQNTRNHEVVIKLERGEVLSRPDNSPLAVYKLLQEMWHLDPNKRMDVFDVYSTLKDFLLQIELKEDYEALQFRPNVPCDDLIMYRKSRKTSAANVAPVLRTNTIEPSILQKTLEQQRVQSLEDDKWLQEQEQIAFPSEEFGTRPNITIKKPDDQSEIDRENDPLFMAISDVSDSIYEFTQQQSCSPIATANFINAIEKILFQLEQLNTISAPHFELLDLPYRKKVEFAQKLLNTNGNNLRQTIRVLDESAPDAVENYHREALRICNVLIIHSKQFLEAIDIARLSSGTANVKSRP